MGRLEKEVERGDEGGGYGNTMCEYVPTTPDRNASLSSRPGTDQGSRRGNLSIVDLQDRNDPATSDVRKIRRNCFSPGRIPPQAAAGPLPSSSLETHTWSLLSVSR